MTKRRFFGGACPERLDLRSSTGLVEGLRMTMWSFRMSTRLIASSHLRVSNLIPTSEPTAVGDVHQREIAREFVVPLAEIAHIIILH